jgi:glycosyltransferase involved in cell wall biosynthesis
LRVLICIPYFTPAYAFGGSVTVAETIVEGLVAAGHRVTVATTDVLDENARIAPGTPGVAGSDVVRFRNVSHHAAARANLYLPRGYRRWLEANIQQFEVVLLLDVYSAISVNGARVAAQAGVPYALQPLGTLSAARERGRSQAKRLFLKWWGLRTVRDASLLVHSTDFERRDFLEVGADPTKLSRLPLPLDLPAPGDVPKAREPTVISVGRLHPIKRLDVLVEAIAIARSEVSGLRLDVVGPGAQLEQELRNLASRLGIAEAVTFHGYVSVEEKFRLLNRAHAGALLSASEGLPMAALEYMACGLPVVLSEGCHIPEADGRAGIVVGNGAPAAAAAIVELLGSPGRYEQLSRGAEDFAREFRRSEVLPAVVEAVGRLSGRGAPTGPPSPATPRTAR